MSNKHTPFHTISHFVRTTKKQHTDTVCRFTSVTQSTQRRINTHLQVVATGCPPDKSPIENVRFFDAVQNQNALVNINSASLCVALDNDKQMALSAVDNSVHGTNTNREWFAYIAQYMLPALTTRTIPDVSSFTASSLTSKITFCFVTKSRIANLSIPNLTPLTPLFVLSQRVARHVSAAMGREVAPFLRWYTKGTKGTKTSDVVRSSEIDFVGTLATRTLPPIVYVTVENDKKRTRRGKHSGGEALLVLFILSIITSMCGGYGVYKTRDYGTFGFNRFQFPAKFYYGLLLVSVGTLVVSSLGLFAGLALGTATVAGAGSLGAVSGDEIKGLRELGTEKYTDDEFIEVHNIFSAEQIDHEKLADTKWAQDQGFTAEGLRADLNVDSVKGVYIEELNAARDSRMDHIKSIEPDKIGEYARKAAEAESKSRTAAMNGIKQLGGGRRHRRRHPSSPAHHQQTPAQYYSLLTLKDATTAHVYYVLIGRAALRSKTGRCLGLLRMPAYFFDAYPESFYMDQYMLLMQRLVYMVAHEEDKLKAGVRQMSLPAPQQKIFLDFIDHFHKTVCKALKITGLTLTPEYEPRKLIMNACCGATSRSAKGAGDDDRRRMSKRCKNIIKALHQKDHLQKIHIIQRNTINCQRLKTRRRASVSVRQRRATTRKRLRASQ